MNPEQAEAHLESLKKINERHERSMGWRPGVFQETRHERIKRIRRWRRLPSHYPDKFTGGDGFKLESKLAIDGHELFVTSTKRKIPTWNWDKSDLLDMEYWDSTIQYNGYCRFMSKPVNERGYNGILTYVPVHGGITYCEHRLGVSVYGFDTAHSGDEENPLVKNMEWMENQCRIMAISIKIAARFELDYLRFNNNYKRAEVIDKYHSAIHKKVGALFRTDNNIGAMINLLSGRL